MGKRKAKETDRQYVIAQLGLFAGGRTDPDEICAYCYSVVFDTMQTADVIASRKTTSGINTPPPEQKFE